MTEQYLEYVRQQLIRATTDLSGSTKGQLVALAENAQFCTSRFKRKPLKVWDEEAQKMVTVWNQPVPGKQSRTKGSHIPLVLPVEYSTASWRRAVKLLPKHQCAWLLWCYSDDMSYTHQIVLVRWAWAEFESRLGACKFAAKTLQRLRALIWLAAQDVQRELRGGEKYLHQHLAEMSGVSKTNWSQHYVHHWETMQQICRELDKTALQTISAMRSQQKEAFSMQKLAKVNFLSQN